MQLLKEILEGMADLFFPQYCIHCGRRLLPEEKFLCLDCYLDLPTLTVDSLTNNTITKLFWGRLPVQNAFAFMHFVSHGPSQAILHELKYKGNKDIGLYFGQAMAHAMKEKNFPDFDIILPVPLHPKKRQIRGYNQAEMIAQGIAQVYEKKVETKAVRRTRFNPTQTRKSKADRWENVKNLFSVTSANRLKGKHILLVDDVVTTGSTIESLATEILKIPGTRISLAFLAMAQEI